MLPERNRLREIARAPESSGAGTEGVVLVEEILEIVRDLAAEAGLRYFPFVADRSVG